jgi:hypothetical protein
MEDPAMRSIQGKVNEEAFTPTQKTGIASNLADDAASIEGDEGNGAWIDIEQALTAGWEIGGSAMPPDAIRGFVAGE